MNWYEMSVQAIEQKLQMKVAKGLKAQEVKRRQQQYGKNEMKTKKKQHDFFILIKQFQDFIIFILLAATCIAALLGEYIDAIAIVTIVFINAIIGFFQERKAEQAIEKLKQLAAPKMIVFRDGIWQEISASEAVPGDLIKLKTGDRVPADVRLIESTYLATEEAALTGESALVEKHAHPLYQKDVPIHDQQNICFKGTLIMKGSGKGVVLRTGMATELGKIATLMESVETTQTPLQWRLAQLGKIFVITVLALTVLTVLIGIYHGNPLYDMFLAGISLAVAVIPEGLPAIVTVALSIGVQRMMKRKVIVRKLAAVESLGCATIICTDKTGTITENKMKAEQLFVGNQTIHITGESNEMDGDFLLHNRPFYEKVSVIQQVLLFGMLCNEATLYIKKGKYVVEGNPTDGALLIAARKFGFTEKSTTSYTIQNYIPFHSAEKQMSVTVQTPKNEQIVIKKGAPEAILPNCLYMLDWNGQTVPIKKDKVMQAVERMSSQALRVIAIAYQTTNRKIGQQNRFVFAGLVGILDPPRSEVKQSLAQCAQAGIQTMMITGDHPQTAAAIGRKVGLFDETKKMLTGADIEQYSVADLTNEIDDVAIVARVNPEQKLKIVQALQNKGHIVAMTGDGINDAPAMKASNIGISMGISGTDVTKEASDIVLMDDNFASIKEAIKEGRHVYNNIRKFIRYLLTSNVGEIFVMLVALLFGFPLPLIPVQILWVNLVTDGLPAIALGLEKPTTNVMDVSPRHPKENIFARGLGAKILSRGICIGIVTLIAFIFTYQTTNHLEYARTIAFTTLVLSQLIHVYDCRSDKGIWYQNPLTNIPLLLAVSSSFLLLLVVLYERNLQHIFQTIPLTIGDWILIIVLSMIPSVIFPKKSHT